MRPFLTARSGAARRRARPGLETLEPRALLSAARNALPPALGWPLASLSVEETPGPYAVGQPITFEVGASPGSLGLKTILEQATIQMRRASGGPWINAGTSLPGDGTVTVFPSLRGRVLFRAVATVIVDADQGHEDPSEEQPGFDDIIDLSGLPPRTAYHQAVQIVNSGVDTGDTQLAFLSPAVGLTVLLAAAPPPPKLPAGVSDEIMVTANGTDPGDGGFAESTNPVIVGPEFKNGKPVMANGKPVIKNRPRGTTVFAATIKEGDKDTEVPAGPLVSDGIRSLTRAPLGDVFKFVDNMSTRAVILTEPGKPESASDVVIVLVIKHDAFERAIDPTKPLGPGNTEKVPAQYSFTVYAYSDSGEKPLNVFVTPKPVRGKPPAVAPEGAIVVPTGTKSIPEEGSLQDLTSMLFPEFGKGAARPPLIVKFASDTNDP